MGPEQTEILLKNALDLALPPGPVGRKAWIKTKERTLTRRGIIWLGQKCNLRCHFCYFVDRLADPAHPEHGFMSLEKAKAICKTLVDFYGNNAVDIQGGEPTIWEPIYELTRYCHEIGLHPTIITNGQALDEVDRVFQYKVSGIRDFLVSVQGLGPVYDRIVGRSGAHMRQMKALRNLQEVGIPFRFNCVLTKDILPQLPQIAGLAMAVGAKVVNFIAFNPFDDQRRRGKRKAENVPTYLELSAHLNHVLDILAGNEVEANVRNLPLCIVEERHRPSMYNHQQIPYDQHENDFAGWSWTGMQPQRMAGGDLTPPVEFGPKVELGLLRTPLRWLGDRSVVGPSLLGAKRRLDRLTGRYGNILRGRLTEEEMYRREAKLRAHDQVGFQHVSACGACDLKLICDGFHGDYARFMGGDEAKPVRVGSIVDDPKFYIKHQLKVVYPDEISRG
jgi:sulfatase maturation enzyme AslB (radical SAM superfamily)